MGLEYNFTDKKGHLLVTTQGRPEDNDDMFRYVNALFGEAKRRGYSCILIDETRTSLRFDILYSIFKSKIPVLERLPSQVISVALISAPHSVELYKFFEGMLKLQFFRFKAFDNMKQGKEWLIKSCENNKKTDTSYSYKATEKGEYVNIEVTGKMDTVDEVLIFAGDIIRLATSFNATCIMICGQTVTVDLDVSQAFKIAQTLGDYIPLLGMRIASIPNPKNMKLDHFFETAFQNRSINYRVFKSVEEAREWLTLKDCRLKS